ncbi:MAG: glycerol-3-phosphate dehydrogenase [Proteobacteria bacterium]|nr:MAG: glycerol-3-phosphate dehydrogenase [Pseudomonadota bacterium]PIE19209.1 MAG: glycerol-3-phosphate dehydrogenase [Pseudomonadota bacterium]
MSSLRERREEAHQRLGEGVYDLAIVGGGINGASIARDAALRGYRVCLLEQSDLGFGTSSRSSRLIHGGLRYLEQAEVGLVFESVSERYTLTHTARHLVRPLAFVVPVYKGDAFPLFAVDLGLWVYDALALFRNYKNHTRLSASQLKRFVPGLRAEGLSGAVRYYDYQTDDARLVLENALGAQQAGAELLTYCRVDGFDYRQNRVKNVRATDLITETELRVRAHCVLCAAGPWTDRVLGMTERPDRWLRPSKGVHIVVPREKLALDDALTMRHPEDRRVLFVLPYHERTVIGTTDTDFDADPDNLEASCEDVRYLLAAAQHAFPEVDLGPDDVLSSWTGLRPLLRQEDAGSPSAVSREHRIQVRTDGVIVIAGGKLTTYRKMAAECLELAAPAIGMAGGTPPRRGEQTRQVPLPGAVGLASEGALEDLTGEVSQPFADGAYVGTHLATVYGSRAREVATIARSEPGASDRVDSELPYVWAEATHAGRHELCCTLEDFMVRRTHLFYRCRDQGLAVAERAAEILGKELGWDASERKAQVAAYEARVEANNAWRGDLCFSD